MMDAAEQDNNRKRGPGQDTAVSSAAFASGSADASFDQLLAQLEAEGDGGAAGAGVSQIFSSSLQQPIPEPRHPVADANAFAPSNLKSGDAGAFAPASDLAPELLRAPTAATVPIPAEPAAGTSPSLAKVGGLPVPVVSADSVNVSALPPAATSAPETAGEFTRIFTQLPKPLSAPPAILAEVAQPSASLPSASLSEPVPVRPATLAEQLQPPPSASAPAFARASQPEPVSAAPAAAETPIPEQPAFAADTTLAAQPMPGEFTQFFRTLSASPTHSATVSPAVGPEPASANLANPLSSPLPTSSPTPSQAFSTTGEAHMLSSSGPRDPAPGTQPIQPLASQSFAPSAAPPPPRPVQTSQQPAATQPGDFTALFQTPSAPTQAGSSQTPPPAYSPAEKSPFPSGFAEPARSQAPSGGFTELLQTLGSSLPSASPSLAPPSAFGQTPTRSAPLAATTPDAFSPVASPPPQAFAARAPESGSPFFPSAPTQPAAGAAGEFTQLMQSLQAPTAPTPPAPAAQTPFFAAAGAHASGGPSEFTRIMQGSAARSADAAVPAFAPAPQSSGAAVGLPIAAPQLPKPAAPALPTAEAKTALQKMMPWLLAANGALLLLLIALAFIFLRHHH